MDGIISWCGSLGFARNDEPKIDFEKMEKLCWWSLSLQKSVIESLVHRIIIISLFTVFILDIVGHFHECAASRIQMDDHRSVRRLFMISPN